MTAKNAHDEARAQREHVDAVAAVRLLIALRSGAPEDAAARAQLAANRQPGGREERARLRAGVVAALAETLQPGDRPLVRWLLEQEIADLEATGHGATEALYVLVAALARFGQAEDALLIWQAHAATPETRAGVDVEQVGRAGIEAIRRALTRARDAGVAGAAEALAWVEAGAAAGAFDDLPEYFAWSDERFGLHVSGPT